MTLTVLFDLDETLLSYNDHLDKFLATYLHGLAEYNPNYPAEVFIAQVMAATRKMIVNTDPSLTLEQVFDLHFYPSLQTTKSNLEDKILAFYSEVYPQFKSLTSPIPAARKIMDYAFKQGWQIIIATNPLFPQVATLQRLEWAGLPVKDYPFTIVTTYESFHFAKPNPFYYAEILAQLGWPDQPVVMVGNDLNEDLHPAAKLGMPVFWINPSDETIPGNFPSGSRKGSLDEVVPWLDWAAGQHFQIPGKNPAALLSVLRSTAAALLTNCSDNGNFLWQQKPSPDEWSPVEIVTHMRDVDHEVNLPRLNQVISEDNPFLPGIDTDPWAVSRDYQHQNGQANLADFVNIRRKSLNLLDNLTEENWSRPARHAIFGPTNLLELCSFIATHDQVHLRQLKEIFTPTGQFA